MVNTILFDLDGTILDTLDNLTIAINEALEVNGLYHSYSRDEVKRFIGNGANVLISMAMGEKAQDKALFDKVKKTYMPLYKKYQEGFVRPYEGLREVLLELRRRNIRLHVVTNKPHELANIIVREHYGDIFECVEGQRDEYPRKPDPYLVRKVLNDTGASEEEAVYVGDSIVDVFTAENANLPFHIVDWGYGDYEAMKEKGIILSVHKPADLLSVLDL